MTTLTGLAIGLVIAGVVRVYAGERFSTRVPLVNIALAALSFIVWLVIGNDVAVAVPIAIGLIFATVVLQLRTVAHMLSRKQGALLGMWALLLVSFATGAIVRG